MLFPKGFAEVVDVVPNPIDELLPPKENVDDGATAGAG